LRLHNNGTRPVNLTAVDEINELAPYVGSPVTIKTQLSSSCHHRNGDRTPVIFVIPKATRYHEHYRRNNNCYDGY